MTELGFLSGADRTYLESVYQETADHGLGDGADQHVTDEAQQWQSVFSSLPGTPLRLLH